MILAIEQLYNETIPAEAARRYGTTGEQLKDLGGFESYVYEFTRDGHSYILKITHTIRRTEAYIHGELEWLNYLGEHGVSIARAVASFAGQWVEVIEQADGSAFLVTCYEKAPGRRPTAEDLKPEMYESLGRLMGQMHAVTKGYVLSNPTYKRQEWYEEEQINVRKYLPAEQARVIELTEELMARLHALPKHRDSYGLLHTDLNFRNFHVDECGVITAFDFDDIGYNWFVNDIAITLFYTRYEKTCSTPGEIRAFVDEYLTHFMNGYLQENELDLRWFKYIPDFLLLRYILIYTTYYQITDLTTASEKEIAWQEQYRQSIENQESVIDFDFEGFAAQLTGARGISATERQPLCVVAPDMSETTPSPLPTDEATTGTN